METHPVMFETTKTINQTDCDGEIGEIPPCLQVQFMANQPDALQKMDQILCW